MKHELVSALVGADRQITARCICGWLSGTHFSVMAATAAFASHANNSEVTSGENKNGNG